MQSNAGKMIRNYLLGDLSNDEREQIELRLLTDRDFIEHLTLFEEELVDDYVHGTLAAGERRKFERSFLSTPEGIGQVRLAAVLRRYASTAPGAHEDETEAAAPERRRLRQYLRLRVSLPAYVLAGAVAMFVLVAAALIAGDLLLRNRLERLQARQPVDTEELQRQLADQQTQTTELAGQLNRERDRRSEIEQELAALRGSKDRQPGIASIVLTPGRIRGTGKENLLLVDSTMKLALLHLIVREADYGVYRVSLHTEAGEKVWTSDSLKGRSGKRGKEVLISLPVSPLSNGNYFLKLRGATAEKNYEDVSTYYFKVVKQS